jgi:hypothetical protein
MPKLLNYKHKIQKTDHGYVLDMLALEETKNYLGGLLGGKLTWFQKSSLEDWVIENGRLRVWTKEKYALKKGLPEARLHP